MKKKIIIIIIPIIIFLIILLTPVFQKLSVNSFLNKKYGNNNFKVISLEKIRTWDDFAQAYYTTYFLKATTSITKEKINVQYTKQTNVNGVMSKIKGSIPFIVETINDNFLSTYYGEKICDHIFNNSNNVAFLEISSYKIPNNCGHIPTIEEIIEYDALKYIYVEIANANYHFDDYGEKEEYLINIFKSIQNTFNIKSDFKMIICLKNEEIKQDYTLSKIEGNIVVESGKNFTLEILNH